MGGTLGPLNTRWWISLGGTLGTLRLPEKEAGTSQSQIPERYQPPIPNDNDHLAKAPCHADRPIIKVLHPGSCFLRHYLPILKTPGRKQTKQERRLE